ncbi:hypothetical protein [Mycoplasmoides fastidiosum]|nr:hypothetical protein [Mycoplasmoides fastidiosum]UUD37806.1 hypothetical protein NPA10_00190 [Mycoplasmoides fastidiosum]
MGRPPYALNSYVKIYNDLGPKLSAKLDKIIVKLFDYNVSIRKNDAISVLELKKTLLSF